MNEKLRRALDATNDVHRPMPIEERDTAEYRLAAKKVLRSRLIDDMESLDTWRPVTYAVSAAVSTNYDPDAQDGVRQLSRLSITDAQHHSGSHSLKFSCPTNLQKLNDVAPGRIYAVPGAFRAVNRENWEDYNRLSVWAYPEGPGIKTITLRMQLHNDGAVKVPDPYNRIGAHNVTLKPGCWNHIVLEIPYLPRDCVTGVGFEYDMVGHENDAADEITFYLDQLELQEVDCDVYEGWIPKSGRLCYSGSGYQPGSVKIAVAAGLSARSFRLVETETGRIVLEKPIQEIETRLGRFDILDFTEVMEEGRYLLTAGDAYSRVFPIAQDIWESSVWHVLNFFLAERCGFDVQGKHRACHADMLLTHGGASIVANGGWHDAADVAQSLPNTSEGAAALLSLALSLEGRGFDRLYERVLDEAKWGLDYVLKMRFGDGWRGTYSSASIWTDGVIGSADDITTEASDNAFVNFGAAYAELLGAKAFAKRDPDYARFCQKTAASDYHFGKAVWERCDALKKRPYKTGGQPFVNSDIIDAQISSMGALAAAELWNSTKDPAYAADAQRFGDILLSLQQRELTGWDVPMAGFFYQDRSRDLIWHHSHLSYSQFPELALRTLLEAFPDSGRYMDWYAALALSGSYYLALSRFTAPYGMVPAGVYHEDEGALGCKLQNGSGLMEPDELARQYAAQVREGAPLGSGYYVRAFPVWFSYRGNYNVLLSEAVSMNTSAAFRGDVALYQAAQDQFRFIVGQNPFGQSTMVGEGYDYVQHYAVQPGQSAGSLTVGMQSLDERDAPFWPQVCTATYKEVWICSATKWIWGMADGFLPGKVTGCIRTQSIRFIHKTTGKEYPVHPLPHSGHYEIELPAGVYRMEADGKGREVTIVSGRTLVLNEIYDLTVSAVRSKGEVAVTVTSRADRALSFRLQVNGAAGMDKTIELPSGTAVTLRGKLLHRNRPFVGLLIPEGNESDRREILDDRLLHMGERREAAR